MKARPHPRPGCCVGDAEAAPVVGNKYPQLVFDHAGGEVHGARPVPVGMQHDVGHRLGYGEAHRVQLGSTDPRTPRVVRHGVSQQRDGLGSRRMRLIQVLANLNHRQMVWNAADYGHQSSDKGELA